MFVEGGIVVNCLQVNQFALGRYEIEPGLSLGWGIFERGSQKEMRGLAKEKRGGKLNPSPGGQKLGSQKSWVKKNELFIGDTSRFGQFYSLKPKRDRIKCKKTWEIYFIGDGHYLHEKG